MWRRLSPTLFTKSGVSGTKIGFDISKDAIQLAASHYFDDAFWCVADLAHSPFAGEQFDAILNILSPSHYEEFGRLLKKVCSCQSSSRCGLFN